ncbi:hypothetical protein PJV89_05225 [Aliarcobacter butzleri]|uniref:hypothetical protein n=1 Tax=Aliarcobacter butzleri TaxID=28197 RepID=UPI00263F1FBB|nr:hypothetical protein [Aliarcobacter butzleri]MDN5077656.1 hypothetical protein [Aliarcobacter butzleri]MDN5118796.1 hypothetical protein [Aliarcobacter butzleri]
MVSKITATIESVPIWGDDNFDANVHENFLKLKELGPQINKTVDEINKTFEDIDTYTKTATTKAGEATQSASDANKAKQTAIQQAELASTKAGEATQSASTANSAKQTATQQAEIATTKADEVNYIKNEMIEVIEALQSDPLSIIASEELAKKLNISDTQDLLTSNDTTKPLSANQGRVLKEFIDAINEILSSDDTTLDELQEIVSFIKQNKSTLDNLSVNNIAGLEIALNDKLSINGKAQSASIADSATTAGTCSGNAATATKLATARTISLSGAVTGSGVFDGSANISISTTNNVSSSIASLGAGAVGTYVLGKNIAASNNYTLGTTIAGSSLVPIDTQNNYSSSSLSGTWRCMGYSSPSTGTLWLRIA